MQQILTNGLKEAIKMNMKIDIGEKPVLRVMKNLAQYSEGKM